ncbi:unnamed protein product, partial [Cladocopium goreaui]
MPGESKIQDFFVFFQESKRVENPGLLRLLPGVEKPGLLRLLRGVAPRGPSRK